MGYISSYIRLFPMAKNGCRIGGEQSGHIIFSKYASTGDGILTSLKMMEVMLAKKKPMSELAAPLKIYPQVLENVRVTDEIEDQVNFTVYVPKVDEHFVGSLAVIPLQLLGYYVSVAKGLDVDKPRNLAKSVTVE